LNTFCLLFNVFTAIRDRVELSKHGTSKQHKDAWKNTRASMCGGNKKHMHRGSEQDYFEETQK